MPGRLEGKVAVVTGSGSGIGEATAMRYAAEGAAVLIADLDGERARRVATEIGSAGGTARPFGVDVRDIAGTEAMARAAVDEWGTIDVLYANAGFGDRRTALTCTPETWNDVIAVNLTGSWLSVRAVLPTMVEARSGSIILQSSGAGLVGIRAGVAYAAAKAGLVGLARQLAADYSSDNVRFNVIAPGTFLTARVQQMYEERVQEGRYESLAAALARSSGVYPLQRVGELEEIAALALFLASDESSFITGVTVPVDGGLTAVRDLVPTASPAR